MFYNLNQEGETTVVVAGGNRYYIGEIDPAEIDKIIQKAQDGKAFDLLLYRTKVILTKWNDEKAVSDIEYLTKEEQYNIISVIIKQYESSKGVSILQ